MKLSQEDARVKVVGLETLMSDPLRRVAGDHLFCIKSFASIDYCYHHQFDIFTRVHN